MAGVYIAEMSAVSVSGAISLIQLKAGANVVCEILEAKVGQSASTTSAMQRIRLVRKSGAATVTSFTPILLHPSDGAAASVGGTTATGTNASGEGTDDDVVDDDVFNVLTGWLHVPVPEKRIWVAPGGIIALKFPAAPGSALTITASLTWREIG
jgi:hypothetical protein